MNFSSSLRPRRIQSADHINQALRIEVSNLTNASFYVALDTRIRVSPGVFDEQLNGSSVST